MVRLWKDSKVVDRLSPGPEADYEVAAAPPGTKAYLEGDRTGTRVVVAVPVGDLQTVVIRQIPTKKPGDAHD